MPFNHTKKLNAVIIQTGEESGTSQWKDIRSQDLNEHSKELLVNHEKEAIMHEEFSGDNVVISREMSVPLKSVW